MCASSSSAAPEKTVISHHGIIDKIHPSTETSLVTRLQLEDSVWKHPDSLALAGALEGKGVKRLSDFPADIQQILPPVGAVDVQIRSLIYIKTDEIAQRLLGTRSGFSHTLQVKNFAKDIPSLFSFLMSIQKIFGSTSSQDLHQGNLDASGLISQSVLRGASTKINELIKTVSDQKKDMLTHKLLTELQNLLKGISVISETMGWSAMMLPLCNITTSREGVTSLDQIKKASYYLTQLSHVVDHLGKNCFSRTPSGEIYAFPNSDAIKTLSRRVSRCLKNRSLSPEGIFNLIEVVRSMTRTYRNHLVYLRSTIRNTKQPTYPVTHLSFDRLVKYEKIGLFAFQKETLKPLIEPSMADSFLIANLNRLDLISAHLNAAYSTSLKENKYIVTQENLDVITDKIEVFINTVNETVKNTGFDLPGELYSCMGVEQNANKILIQLKSELLFLKEVNISHPFGLEVAFTSYLGVKGALELCMSDMLVCLTKILVNSTREYRRSLRTDKKKQTETNEHHRAHLQVILEAIDQLITTFDTQGPPLVTNLDQTFRPKLKKVQQPHRTPKQQKRTRRRGRAPARARMRVKPAAACSSSSAAPAPTDMASEVVVPTVTTVSKIPAASSSAPEEREEVSATNLQMESAMLEHIANQLVEKLSQKRPTGPTKSARNVKWRTLFSELVNKGWKMLGGRKGGHTKWRHPEKSGTITVPRHGAKPTVSIGVVQQVRDQMESAESREEGDKPEVQTTPTKKVKAKKHRPVRR